MPKVRVHNFSMSLDGYGAGPKQSVDAPLGVRGEGLHEWLVSTRFFQTMIGADGGAEGLDNDFARAGDDGIGATVMGRNMFGPIRGDWPDESWRGWWGDEPPYHHDVFVLTHHARDPVPMEGGTTFYFVTDGIHAAPDRAFEAARGRDVRVGGGVSTVQAYLRARLIDELHVAIAPVFLGGGERLFDNLDGGLDGYEVAELVSSPAAMHVRLFRNDARP